MITTTLPRSRAALAVTLVACLALVIAACGQSKEDKAMDTVCSARADINQQINTLKGLNAGNFTVDKVQQSITAITSDLSKISNAQGDLKGSRKTQVQNATQEFKSTMTDLVKTVGRSLSTSDAATQATQALQQLSAEYQKALAPIDCSNNS
jgi:hypothetical protein